MELLIKNVVLTDWQGERYGELYIKDGYMAEIGENLNKKCQSIDGQGRRLLPAFIDMHCHFRDPGFTYKEDILSGSKAAAKGGYTAVNLMANTKPVCSSKEVLDYVYKKALEIDVIKLHQTVSITKNLEGKDISHLNELDSRVRFISDDGKGIYKSEIVRKAMMMAKELGITIISHAENEDISTRDSRQSENTMTLRDISLAKLTGGRLHMAHVSTKEAIAYIIEAKKQGIAVSCEVTPHHISSLGDKNYRVNPPLREEEDIAALINAIKGGYVDVIATDHAPHSLEDKKNGAPGISGLETAFSLCYTSLVKNGHITLSYLSELMSKRPAGLMGYNLGEFKVGIEGDVVLVDTDSEEQVCGESFHSKGKNTHIEGERLWGKVLMTIRGGKVIYDYGFTK